MVVRLEQFKREAKALGRDNNSIQELKAWAMSKLSGNFSLGNDVIVVHDSDTGQIFGIVKTGNSEIALKTLSEYLEPEDPQEALDYLKDHTRLEAFTVLDPK